MHNDLSSERVHWLWSNVRPETVIEYLKFWRQRLWRLRSSGIWCRVVREIASFQRNLYRQSIAEGITSSIYRVESYSYTLKVKAAGSSETLIPLFRIRGCHIPQDSNLHILEQTLHRMDLCMYKGWAIKLALAPRPLMIYCASPLATAMIMTAAALRIVLAHGSKPT
jgi:hypothetical protein